MLPREMNCRSGIMKTSDTSSQAQSSEGEEFRRQLYETYGFLLDKYGGHVVEESYDKHGCAVIIQVDGSRFWILWGDEREGRDVRVLIGCPDSQSPLNEWESTVAILYFIADREGQSRPSSVACWDTPEALERIVQFYRNPKYPEWCAEFTEWYRQ